jgi:hypothetical protein
MEKRSAKFVILLLLLFVVDFAFGQCSMCRAVSESNMKGGGAAAVGLNNGIMYLMAFPYIMIATVAFLWYRHRQANK